MRIEARAVRIPGDDIDTDVLYPGQFLSITRVEKMAVHLFEGLDPTLRGRLGGDTALVVGSNFGSGSSREHVPQAMRASGIRFLVGHGFARIFSRNCVNLGVPPIVCPEAVEAAVDDGPIVLDLDACTVLVGGVAYPFPAPPPFMRQIHAAGGLVPWVQARVSATTRVV